MCLVFNYWLRSWKLKLQWTMKWAHINSQIFIMILCQYCSLSKFKTALHLFTWFVTSRSCLTLLRAIYPANCRSPRTRANSSEFASSSPTPILRRTFAGVRRSSLEFARVRPYYAANWRTVRQKIRSREEIPVTSDERHVRRERGSLRT